MELTGEIDINAPRDRVWAALHDPVILEACIPGAETVAALSPTEFTAKVSASIGPVKAKFGGNVTLSEIDAPNALTLTGSGTGGVAGFAKGSARVTLTDAAPGVTRLSYRVEAATGGKLAQLGSRLIEGTARKLADAFFARFSAALAVDPEPVSPPALPPVVWVPGLILIVGSLVWSVN